MKSFSFASFLLIVLILINIGFYTQLEDTTKSLDTDINQIISLSKEKDLTKAHKEFNNLKEKIKNDKKTWLFVINHRELDDIEISLKFIDGYFMEKNKSEIIANLHTLKFYVENIYTREKITLTNIF